MVDRSDVSIMYDDSLDIAANAVIESASFDSAANAQPGSCEIVLKDLDRDLSFITGKTLKLIVDGQQLWSGFTLINGRSSFFPAGDGLENTKARKWVLRGVDNNILLDRRVIRNTGDYLSAIPNITTDTYDGDIIKYGLANYFDSLGAIDITSQIDNVVIPADSPDGHITEEFPWAWPQQGSMLRELLKELSERYSAAVYYIGPDDAVHFHAIQDIESPWGFSDRPNNGAISSPTGFEGAYWGFRELVADEDGSDFATDAFVWGGSEWAGAAGGTLFARATDAALEAIHGKWQWPETHFGQYKTQETVTQRANVIVYGNPDGTAGGAEPGSVPGEGPRGLRFPQWHYSFKWFTGDVPTLAGVPRHIYPGDLVPIQLWAFSEDEGVTPFTKFLPLRSLRVTFPSGAADGKAYTEFDGSFDLRNQDSKFLWAYLRSRETSLTTTSVSVVTNDSTSAAYGSFGQFTPIPVTDGVTTVFYTRLNAGATTIGYIPLTTTLFLNGLEQRLGIEYTESDPAAGEITLYSAPHSTDTLWMTCRTQAA
jgi:hypothetical protein